MTEWIVALVGIVAIVAIVAIVRRAHENDSNLGRESLDEIIAREQLGYGPPNWPMNGGRHVHDDEEPVA